MMIASTRARVARTETGFLVTRTLLDASGEPVQIRRWRYTIQGATAAADRLLDELLAAGEGAAFALRTTAERATRRALAAQQRMRPQASALHALKADSVRTTNAYFDIGRDLAAQCAEA